MCIIGCGGCGEELRAAMLILPLFGLLRPVNGVGWCLHSIYDTWDEAFERAVALGFVTYQIVPV